MSGRIIVINPGSGDAGDYADSTPTLENAETNAAMFCVDLGPGSSYRLLREEPLDGRWPYEVATPNHSLHLVQMPGIPLERVRWLGPASGNIWLFPRLFVDGDSWAWAYALKRVSEGDYA